MPKKHGLSALKPHITYGHENSLKTLITDTVQLILSLAVRNDYKNEGLPPNSKIIPDRIINDVSELV